MDLPDEPQADGQFLEPFDPVLESGHVVQDLAHIPLRHAGSLRALEQQQVREGGLRALDLRGKHGFLSDVGIEQEFRVRQMGCDGIEPPESPAGFFGQGLQFGAILDRRVRRQRGREKAVVWLRPGLSLPAACSGTFPWDILGHNVIIDRQSLIVNILIKLYCHNASLPARRENFRAGALANGVWAESGIPKIGEPNARHDCIYGMAASPNGTGLQYHVKCIACG